MRHFGRNIILESSYNIDRYVLCKTQSLLEYHSCGLHVNSKSEVPFTVFRSASISMRSSSAPLALVRVDLLVYPPVISERFFATLICSRVRNIEDNDGSPRYPDLEIDEEESPIAGLAADIPELDSEGVIIESKADLSTTRMLEFALNLSVLAVVADKFSSPEDKVNNRFLILGSVCRESRKRRSFSPISLKTSVDMTYMFPMRITHQFNILV